MVRTKATEADVEIGKRCRRLRRLHDETQLELGNAIEVSDAMIVYYEKGTTPIPREKLQKIADR